MDLHPLGRQAGDLGGVHPIHGLKLGTGPDLAGVGAQVHCTVERLHHEVGKKWDFVHRLDFLGGAG